MVKQTIGIDLKTSIQIVVKQLLNITLLLCEKWPQLKQKKIFLLGKWGNVVASLMKEAKKIPNNEPV